jgi:hypothetical protein
VGVNAGASAECGSPDWSFVRVWREKRL